MVCIIMLEYKWDIIVSSGDEIPVFFFLFETALPERMKYKIL